MQYEPAANPVPNAVHVPAGGHPSRQTHREPSLSLLALLTLLFLPSALFARPQPSARIPLESLGFQPLSQRYLLGGSSMITLHYVDATHALVTFAAHRLIPRIPNDPPTDQDRNVDAFLIELPSGRILARAEWFLHDHGQYLWDLGHGQFLLRIQNDLTTFAPLAHLDHGQSFTQRPFLRSTRRIVFASLSTDAGLLTVETADPIPLVDPDGQPGSNLGPGPDRPAAPPPTNIQINFYRLTQSSGPEGAVVARTAGMALSHRAVDLPLTPGGLLHTLDQGHQRWAFDFRSHTGKVTQLALFDSTCRPRTAFISPSEFIALGCRSGDARQQLAGFNLRGDAMWVQALTGPYVAPTLAFAPAAGRFAFARVGVSAVAFADTIEPALFNAQSVDVIQDDSGKTLLHLECTPIVRAGQNFALAPDGMSLAVIREGAIEIYPLPPLGKDDKTAIQLAQKSTPPPTEADVDVTETPNPKNSTLNSSAQAVPTETTSPQLPSPQLPGLSSGQNQGVDQPVALDKSSNPVQPGTPSSSSTTPLDPAQSAQQQPSPTDTAAPDPPVRRKPPTLYNPSAPSPDAPPQSTAAPQ